MKSWTGKKYWVGGFTNEYTLVPNKNTLKYEIERFKGMMSLERMTITDENGDIICDEQKESPLAAPAKATSGSKTTKGKKAVRSKNGIADEAKRRVCRPQDL